MSLPQGTVTFLFTDIEGSTKLWEQHPEMMRVVLARHDAILTTSVEKHEGIVIRSRGEGDSFFAVFARATDAVATACAIQRALVSESWPAQIPIRVRVAVHTGEAQLREGDYFGSAINRCARLRAIAYGGQAIISQATYELVRDALPEGASLRDLSTHRLRDLTRPERVFQLVHPGLPVDFPLLKSLDILPNNLPCQLTSFIGREREMAEIKQLLSSTSLLTLTGSGGCGKTRLALQVAADLLEEYPDGVWVVELAALSDPALVPQAVASTLDVREQPSRALMDTLTDYLKPKVLMLILDNCEHLLAACSQLADTLLRACPHLRILASSREGLGIAGEITWRVPSLAMPDSQRLPPMESLTQYEAVRLFIERAVAVLPTFQVTNPNAPAVAQICHRLDGIPLAIELAATRVKALSVEEIAVRLDDRFRLLIGGSRTALPRQQTLRAAIDWSFDLLSAVERILLCRLSVFAGGCTLEAAEEVCSGERIQKDEILDLVTHLVDKSLVWAQQHGGQTRYLLLETVRQYARDKLLEVGDSAHVRNHHLDYYLKLAERAEPHLVDSQSLIWLEQLDWDYDNLRVAMEWASGSNQTEAGLGIAGALGEFWFVRGYFSEGRRWLDALLSKGKGASASARAPALRTAGSMAWSQGDYSQTAAFYEEALALSRGLGDKRGIAWSLLGLGDAA